MPSLSSCRSVAIEHRAVRGVGRAPAALGIAGKLIARAQAMADAAAHHNQLTVDASRILESEYVCLDPDCTLTDARAEPREKFAWRKESERVQGNEWVAAWLLDVEIFVSCAVLPEHGQGGCRSDSARLQAADEPLPETTSWSLEE